MKDVIIVGAGPCGLSAAIECQDAGLDTLVLEKGCVVNSIYQYPTYMTFFSTPELLEIGGVPFMTENAKPTRREALNYYSTVALRKRLNIRTYEEVVKVERLDGAFAVHTVTMHGVRNRYETRHVVIATGYFDNPNLLGIPGEELPKVSHFFREAHPYAGTNVAIIGGNNSAVDAALELLRVDAKVTVVYRGPDYSPKIKPWVLPTFRSAVDKGRIRMMFNSRVVRIGDEWIDVSSADGTVERLDNDFVLAMTGFRPDRAFLTAAGVEMDPETDKPRINPETMETNVPGLYIAGVIASGREANEIFIETGRFHGDLIARHIVSQR